MLNVSSGVDGGAQADGRGSHPSQLCTPASLWEGGSRGQEVLAGDISSLNEVDGMHDGVQRKISLMVTEQPRNTLPLPTDPATHPPTHQGAECVTVKPSPEHRAEEIRLYTHTHTHSPQERLPQLGSGHQASLPAFLSSSRNTEGRWNRSEVRRDLSPPRSNSLILKVLILQRFSKIGISGQRSQLPS